MLVKEIMHEDPVLCTPETSLKDVAKAMVQYDCGSIPVVEDRHSKKLIGIITDRDITCRTIAKEKNPLKMIARDCMSQPVVTVSPETTLEDCRQIMEENQIRRIPVVNDSGRCCGVVTQAHIAKKASVHDAAKLVKHVSQKSGSPSAVGAR